MRTRLRMITTHMNRDQITDKLKTLLGQQQKITIDLSTISEETRIDRIGFDSISILDFATFPPTVRHLDNIANTVIGPPSNIAITPDKSLALIANSVKLDPEAPSKWSSWTFQKTGKTRVKTSRIRSFRS